jgi:PIN domain nuclease of toxin-antitoxin system
VRVLLDTHAFLWWITDDASLSPRAREIIGDGDNVLFLSTASAWEIAIKVSLGRLTLPGRPERFIPEQLALNAIDSLPVHLSHALHVYNLPNHHRDPFDRMLVVQSQLEDLPLLSADPQLAQYAIDILW